MAYFFRVLTPKSDPIGVGPIWRRLMTDGRRAVLSHSAELKTFDQLIVTHPDGAPICRVERNRVDDEGLGRIEIGEFLEEIRDAKPASAADWLTRYLARVKTIYAIETLEGVSAGDGWGVVNSVREGILGAAGGITQADFQGFSNEQGFHILWQFLDEVSGEWNMAVLADDGGWRTFRMDRGDQTQREAFQRGEVPEAARPIEQAP